jgi:hypothetical protein
MLSFSKFLDESYQNLDDHTYQDRYEKMFARYALNEVPLRMNEDEMKECAKLYGNVDVGVVYFGGKMNYKEEYKSIINLKPGDRKHFKLQSASPHEEDARTYMDYVKSYDELTMLSALKSAYEQGSAGKFGVYLLELEPTPNQVIFSTFGPTVRKLNHSAETECILYGDIKVKSVKIREALTTENYHEILLKDFPDILQSEFVTGWIRKIIKKIPSSLAKNLITKIDTANKALAFFKWSASSLYVIEQLTYNDLMANHHIKNILNNYIRVDGSRILLNIPGQLAVGLPHHLEQDILLKHKEMLVKQSKEQLKNLPTQYKCLFSNGKNSKNALILDDNAYAILASLLFQAEHGKKVKHPIISDLNNISKQIKSNLNELVLTKNLYDYNNPDDLSDIQRLFASALELKTYASLLSSNMNYVDAAISYFYNSFAKGSIKDRRMLSAYTTILTSVLQKVHTSK